MSKKTETFKLTIKREEWLHGEGCGESTLFRDYDGKKCCVGIYLSALGMRDDELLENATASETDTSRVPEQALWLLSEYKGADSKDAWCLYRTNDLKRQPRREAKIKELFAKHGVEVTFE